MLKNLLMMSRSEISLQFEGIVSTHFLGIGCIREKTFLKDV